MVLLSQSTITHTGEMGNLQIWCAVATLPVILMSYFFKKIIWLVGFCFVCFVLFVCLVYFAARSFHLFFIPSWCWSSHAETLYFPKSVSLLNACVWFLYPAVGKACPIKMKGKSETSLLRQALKKPETLHKRKYLFAVIKNILGVWRSLLFYFLLGFFCAFSF